MIKVGSIPAFVVPDMIIGFSSGNLLKKFDCDIDRAVGNLSTLGCNAIELHFPEEDFERIDLGSWQPFKKFEYISVHAQTIVNLNKSKKILDFIQKAHEAIHFDNVVIHPDTVEDWKMFSSYDFPIGIENMDWRKTAFKDAKDLAEILSGNAGIKLVLDLNHCYTVDPTMDSAREMYKHLGSRIGEIHLSGFNKFHDPLYKTRQLDIVKAVPIQDIPIIIESFGDAYINLEESAKELEYIRKNLE